ncbi:MAG: FHA domain-containing protein [Polyangiales bacterium]
MLEEAYKIACEKMVATTPSVTGYRVFWVRQQEVGWIDLPVGGAYAILGRHSECDGILAQDPSISLRHLLATTVEVADGVALRLLDLQTAVSFFLADNIPRQSIVVFGSVAVRVGEYVVGCVPIEETGNGLQLRLGPLPRAEVADARDLRSRAVSRPPAQSSRDHDYSPDITHVTSIPAPSRLEETFGSRADPSVAHLTPRRGTLSASVDLTASELDLGVLIGCASRCYDEGLQAVLDQNISRGHVLVMRHQDRLEAFDLCSMQGTFKDGHRVRRQRIEDGGAVLTLGAIAPVTLEFVLQSDQRA